MQFPDSQLELLLNLVWLLLAVPAYWLWRASADVRDRRHSSAMQALLALGCVLVLLFPVISATDDLHAMRAEIEESSSSKRSVRQAPSDRASVWNVRLQTLPAIAENFTTFAPGVETAYLAISPNSSLPTRPPVLCVGRAPPAGHLT